MDTLAANGPKPDHHGNPDHLADDQSRMTYSFNIGEVHFIVINTDTLTTEKDTHGHSYPGWVPYNWIEQNVRSAQANRNVSAIFLIGHKPIMPHPQHEEDAILNTKEHPLGDHLQDLFQANDKVRAYLCAHEHLWHRSPLNKDKHVWQVIAAIVPGTPYLTLDVSSWDTISIS